MNENDGQPGSSWPPVHYEEAVRNGALPSAYRETRLIDCDRRDKARRSRAPFREHDAAFVRADTARGYSRCRARDIAPLSSRIVYLPLIARDFQFEPLETRVLIYLSAAQRANKPRGHKDGRDG